MRMKYFWILLNSILVALSLLGGYNSMAPDRLRHTNPDPVLCLNILLVMPLFAMGSVRYSIRRWKSDPLPRPPWSRDPFNWWGDPLQSLFVSTCIMGAMTVGSAVHHPGHGSVGFWTLGVYACLAIGLSAGQNLVYRIYPEHIASNHVE